MNLPISLYFLVWQLSCDGVIFVMELCSYVAILILIRSYFQFIESGGANTVASNRAANATKLRNGFVKLNKIRGDP